MQVWPFSFVICYLADNNQYHIKTFLAKWKIQGVHWAPLGVPMCPSWYLLVIWRNPDPHFLSEKICLKSTKYCYAILVCLTAPPSFCCCQRISRVWFLFPACPIVHCPPWHISNFKGACKHVWVHYYILLSQFQEI